MEAKDSVAITAQVAPVLVQAIKDTKDHNKLFLLTQGLSAVVPGMEAKEAATVTAQVAPVLVQAIKDTKDPRVLWALVSGLSAVVTRMQAKDAAAIAGEAAATLAQAMKDIENPNVLYALAQGKLAAHLVPKQAAQAATILVQAMRNEKNYHTLSMLTEGLSAVAARIEAKEASAVAGQSSLILVQAMEDSSDLPVLTKALSALLSTIPPTTPPCSATVASAVAFPAGTGHPLAILALILPAAEPPPCRLSTQQLVELLKMPTCFGEARHVILDCLGNRYRHTFSDVWAFVRFAKEQNLDLDFISPPQRPERPAASPR
jgi:hypothetical protein